MTETKVKKLSEEELLKAKNEENNNEDGSSATANNDFEYKILVNNEKITLNTDKYGASLVDKLQGHGIHIQQNGDMIILSGSGGKGKACGGRLLVNTKGGQLTKTGPVVVERRGSSKSPLEGSGSNNTEDTSSIALSEMNYGNVETETLGEHYIRARDIVLDATDTITLRANQVVIDSADYRIGAGNIEESSDTKSEVVTSQKNSEVKEDVERQYDTRATKVTVGSGSISRRIRGDLKVWVAGVADMQFQGKTVGIPLVMNRTAGLNIGVNGVGSSGAVVLNTNDLVEIKATKDITFESTAGKFELTALGASKIDATGGLDIKAAGDMDIETEGKLTVKATDDFKVTAAKIYLN